METVTQNSDPDSPNQHHVNHHNHHNSRVVVEATPVKYASYDTTRGYVVSNNKCLDVGWPYSVSPSSGIIQPVQVMSTPQLELSGSPHKETIKKHSSSPQHQLITPKIEEIKQDTPLMQSQDSPGTHHISTPQHFSPIPTSNQGDIPSRQTVLMWGSHNSTPVNSRSPLSDGTTSQDYQHHQINTVPVTVNHQITTVQVTDEQHSIESLKGLTEINSHQWNGAEDTRKMETVTQNSDPDSPNQHHVNHHNHHNSRVVMVL
ncbi:uncharacterized protein LOC115882849 [Sitophilus oryzae]|uniref:Uncharacterized protein LOC115882849 n=1 Tax=Sitophilus oryzae TaxID=7048 RepID=A0A6J2XZM0_SITOR|nr:uncharacterized protein LOC115882849 [Sitophilus oryzae]